MSRHVPIPFRLSVPLILVAALLFKHSLPAQDAPAPSPAAKDPALEGYYVANGAYNRKLYPVAIQQYEAFLKAHPDHAKADLARRGLALSHYASKQYKEALAPLAALLAKEKLDPTISRERLVMMRGQCLLITGAKDEAGTLYVSEITNLKTPAYQAAALSSICDVAFANAEWKEVVTWTGKLLAAKLTDEQSARGYYQQGYARYQLGQPEEALASLAKLAGLKVDESWLTRGQYLAGECHNRLKRYKEAEAAFVAALPGLTGSDAVECRYRLGLTRFVLKNYEEAADDLTAYLTAAPEGPNASDAQLYLARTHLERASFKTAGTQLKALAAGKGKVAARASLWLARVYTRPEEKDYATAAAVLGDAVETFADSEVIDDLRFDYANALMARAEPDWKTALASLLLVQASESFGQQAEALNQVAVCQQKLKSYEESLASNERFLATYPDHPLAGEARFMGAENRFLLGNLEEASKGYADFLAKHEEHPSRKAALFRQAQIHHASGRWEECLATATPLLTDKPAGPLYAQLPFIVGDALFRMENWSGAIAPLTEFLSSRIKTDANKGRVVVADPNVDTALVQLAVCYDRTDEKEQALDQLLTIVAHYPNPSAQLPLALAEQGRLAYETGNLKLARTALEKFLSTDTPDNALFAKNATAQRPRVCYYLGWIAASEQKHAEAAQRFDQVVKIGPNHPLAPDAALQHGIALFNATTFEEAASQFQSILKNYPQHPKLARVVFHLGLALARQKMWTEAGNQFKRITQEFPKSEFADQASYEWAWCERGLDRMEQATGLYELILKNYPQSPLTPKVQSELAELNVDSGAQDRIIAQLSATLTNVTDEALREELRYQLANAHFKKGDHQNAAKQFEALLADYPKSKLLASISFQAGESRLQVGEIEAARSHFANAAGIAGSPQALTESITMRLAETQALTGDHAGSAKSYLAFLETFPESRWLRNARFGFALATEQGGNPATALPEYAKLLAEPRTDLWTVRSRFQTGACQAKLKKYDQAIVEFVKVEISYPQYPQWQAQAVLEIGRVLLAQQKPEQAVERFEEVIRRFAKEEAAAEAKKLLAASTKPAN